MADVIKFGDFKRKKFEIVTNTSALHNTADIPSKEIEEIVNEALAAMLIELENEGIDIEHNKLLMRLEMMSRMLEETLAEVKGAPMSDWMKRLLIHF